MGSFREPQQRHTAFIGPLLCPLTWSSNASNPVENSRLNSHMDAMEFTRAALACLFSSSKCVHLLSPLCKNSKHKFIFTSIYT